MFQPLGLETQMEAFLISLSSVAIAEMGDRTQLLSLMLAARYRQPWPILAGVLLATLANHAAAGAIGTLFGAYLMRASFFMTVQGVVHSCGPTQVTAVCSAPMEASPAHRNNSPGLAAARRLSGSITAQKLDLPH